MKTDKTKSSILNAIAMITQTGIISLLSLISTNLILKNYGSDFNGVVATASQLINLLLIVEGGFSLAINVALFKPYVENNQTKINSIMSASKKIFFKIGIIFFILGIAISLIYPLFIKSNLNYITIFLIFLMVISATAYNLMFIIKSQIMFQVSQKEYTVAFLGTMVNLVSSIVTIVLVYNKINMLIVRLFLLIFTLINGILILILYKKRFPNINTNCKPDYNEIKGTKDIMIQKLTSVVYMASPLLFISTFISTKMASVYAVYYSIYNIIKMLLSSMVAAPINGFGQLLSKSKDDDTYQKFKLYEYITILSSTILLSSVLVVILPFISLYTKSITDINYINLPIAIMLALILFLEIIHIPSGSIINITGNFKIAKKFQTITCIILVSLLSIGGYFYGIYGILAGTIITNILLASMEIKYTHKKIFNANIKNIINKLITNLFLIILLVVIERLLLPQIDSYIKFFAFGFIIFIINVFIILIVNKIFFNNEIKGINKLLTEMRKKIIKKK